MNIQAQPHPKKPKEYKVSNHLNSHIGDQFHLFQIAIKMKNADLPDIFIVNAVRTALEFDGVSDLMKLWENEKDEQEQAEIIADIQDMINACLQQDKSEEIYVKFNDLEAIAKNIRAFKDSLLQVVIEQGGLSHLAQLTSIPQPSLSRFFNSNSMPQRSTLLKIAKVLDLDAIKIELLWNK